MLPCILLRHRWDRNSISFLCVAEMKLGLSSIIFALFPSICVFALVRHWGFCAFGIGLRLFGIIFVVLGFCFRLAFGFLYV